MPHSNEHTKTKEGYILEVEHLLDLDENLPREFYRLDIEKARELYECTLISGRAGFEFCAIKFDLNVIGIFKNGQT